MDVRLVTVEDRDVGDEDKLRDLGAKGFAFFPVVQPFVLATVARVGDWGNANLG